MKTTLTLSLALALILPAVAAPAPNDGVVTYSGYLRNSAGNPETTAQNLVFTLWDAATAGNTVWTQTVNGVQPDTAGWFSVVLGASPAAFPPGEFLSQAWLGVKVGAEAEMAPRTKLSSAPHALSVDYAGLSGCGATTNQILQWNGSAWSCIATPSGTGSGLTAVAHDASLAGSGTAGAPLTLMACADGQILQRTGGAWSCIPTPTGGTAGVTSVGATAPVTSSGGAAPVIGMSAASGISSGYITAADYISFSGKAPTPVAACGAGQVLTWGGSPPGFACVTDTNSGGTVTSVTATGTGNPITVTSGTTTPALAFRACAAGQVLQYVGAASGWVCATVSPVVATAAGCGITCTAIPAGNTTTTYTINSVSITTPAAGDVKVDFDGSVECNFSAGGTATAIQLYGQLTNSNVGSALGYLDGGAVFRYSPNGGVLPGLYDSSMNAHRTFTVGAAGTYTFYFRANNWPGGGIPPACTFFGGNMTAVYYP